jgi:hypothetical protein
MDSKNDVKKPMKTFFVQYGVATVGLDGERENFHLGLVVAPNAKTARRYAIKSHVDDDFERGRWIDYNGHRAFQISERACDCDANSIYWINEMTEISTSDAAVLRKYLPTVDHLETPQETMAGVQC